ncbi:MAG: hypothetical protein IJP86_08505 [Synergistaceae bacterium]|nr:hypothetical protein [Synergistaceae bacterium]
MEKGTFTVTLADGTQLGNLELNGNNFITTQEITESTFAGKLGKVVIAGDTEADEAGLIGEHSNMELVQIQKHGAENWFILRDIPADELERMQNRGDIDYIAMMTGVTL